MTKLFAVNQQIEELMRKLEPDPESGEIKADEEEVIALFDRLSLKHEDILDNLAKMYLNLKAALEQIQAEKSCLEERGKRIRQKKERLLKILDMECGGKNADLGVAALCHRKNKSVEVTDPEAAYRWLKRKGHPECYRIHKPEIHKDKVAKLLDDGEEIPGLKRVTTTSCFLK